MLQSITSIEVPAQKAEAKSQNDAESTIVEDLGGDTVEDNKNSIDAQFENAGYQR